MRTTATADSSGVACTKSLYVCNLTSAFCNDFYLCNLTSNL